MNCETNLVSYNKLSNCNLINSIQSILNKSIKDNDKVLAIQHYIDNIKENDYENKYGFEQFNNIIYLNRGGYGSVFSANHILDGNIYAIKVIPLYYNILCTPDKMNNIIINKLREIRYLSKLNHRNIIKYHTS